jgi:hypothetical protein
MWTNKILRCVPYSTKYIYTCLPPHPNWDSPTPSPASKVCPPPPEPKGEIHTRLFGRGWESQFRRPEKKLSTLSTLCSIPSLLQPITLLSPPAGLDKFLPASQSEEIRQNGGNFGRASWGVEVEWSQFQLWIWYDCCSETSV